MQKRTNFSPIATSIEQSKRLLAAGIDQASADMFWINVEVWNREEKRLVREWFINVGQCQFQTHPNYCPAWSLSRLIDLIAETGVPINYGPMKDSVSVLDHAVNALEYQLLHANH